MCSESDADVLLYCTSLTPVLLFAVRASVLWHQAWPAAPPNDQGVAAGSAQAAHLSPRGPAELWITAKTQAGLWQRAHQGCNDNGSLDLHWRGQYRWSILHAVWSIIFIQLILNINIKKWMLFKCVEIFHGMFCQYCRVPLIFIQIKWPYICVRSMMSYLTYKTLNHWNIEKRLSSVYWEHL